MTRYLRCAPLDRYQMRPSCKIDFLKQVPRCHHGEVADVLVPCASIVREASPPMSMMSSQDPDTQHFLAPFSRRTEEPLSRKRKSPSLRVIFPGIILSILPSIYTAICCTTYYDVSTSFPRFFEEQNGKCTRFQKIV